MRDRYVDDAESQSYGDGFVTEAKRQSSLSPFLGTLSKAVAQATGELVQAGTKAGTLRSAVTDETPSKNAALAAAQGALSHVNDVVHAHRDQVKAKDFFPQGRKGVKTSARAVLEALGKCIAGLKKYSSKIPGAAAEQKRLEATKKALAQSLAKTTSAHSSAAAASPALKKARARWKTSYKAAKLGTEALLLLAGLDQKKPADVPSAMKSFFQDLSGGRAPRKRTTTAKAGASSAASKPAP